MKVRNVLAVVVAAGSMSLMDHAMLAQGPAKVGGRKYLPSTEYIIPPALGSGMVSGVAVNADGIVYAFRRANPFILAMDQAGKVIGPLGDEAKPLIGTWTHGIKVDPEQNIWITGGPTGHQVLKLSPQGKVLMTLGYASGTSDTTFNMPTDVAVRANGDIFVTDGYGSSRIVKLSKEGRFVKAWGTRGNLPGQFTIPHTIVVDERRNRLLVGDRENGRVQMFDFEGRYLGQWNHVGSPWGLAIHEDTVFIGDGNLRKVLAVEAATGRLIDMIEVGRVHFINTDKEGNLYVTEGSVRKYALRKGS